MKTTTTTIKAEVTFISPLVASGKFRRSSEGVPVLTDYQWIEAVKEINKHSNRFFYKEAEQLLSISSRYINLLDTSPSYASFADGDVGNSEPVEVIPPGCRCVVTFICHGESALDAVKRALNEGSVHGFGFHRQSGYGRFTWKEVTDNE